MKFLTARWEHLLLANYSVDARLLEPFVPRGTRLDLFQGHCFVSLVAFMFNQTRVLGIPIPLHRHFEEVNLRFYVAPDKDPSMRAVTFIKEIVPRAAIPLISNTLFNENYVALPMDHRNADSTHWYSWGNREKSAERSGMPEPLPNTFADLPDPNTNHLFAASIESELALPPSGSIGEFITEHYWGYAQGRRNTLEYQVEHPQWQCSPVNEYLIDVDFGSLYGEPFAFLDDQTPYNVLYARGSEVSVSFPSRLRPSSAV